MFLVNQLWTPGYFKRKQEITSDLKLVKILQNLKNHLDIVMLNSVEIDQFLGFDTEMYALVQFQVSDR